MKIKSRTLYDGGKAFDAYMDGCTLVSVHGHRRPANTISPEEITVSWSSIGSVTPAEAREFASAIIEIADAVENAEGRE